MCRGFFRPEVEAVLKMLAGATLIGLIALPVAWGYEQRRQARTWQQIACAYRIRDVVRRTPIVVRLDSARDPCSTLERLGLDLEVPGH